LIHVNTPADISATLKRNSMKMHYVRDTFMPQTKLPIRYVDGSTIKLFTGVQKTFNEFTTKQWSLNSVNTIIRKIDKLVQ